LNDQGCHNLVSVRIPRIRQAGGRIQAGDPIARLSANGDKDATNDDFAVRLNGQG
jgi:hypothetical protein